jgi:hypothetical protein
MRPTGSSSTRPVDPPCSAPRLHRAPASHTPHEPVPVPAKLGLLVVRQHGACCHRTIQLSKHGLPLEVEARFRGSADGRGVWIALGHEGSELLPLRLHGLKPRLTRRRKVRVECLEPGDLVHRKTQQLALPEQPLGTSAAASPLPTAAPGAPADRIHTLL